MTLSTPLPEHGERMSATKIAGKESCMSTTRMIEVSTLAAGIGR